MSAEQTYTLFGLAVSELSSVELSKNSQTTKLLLLDSLLREMEYFIAFDETWNKDDSYEIYLVVRYIDS